MIPWFDVGAERLLGVNALSRADLIKAIDRRLAQGRGFALATLNLDHLVKLRRSEAFRRAYLETSFVTADGWPVALLSRLQGRPVELIPGSDLLGPLCAAAAARGAPVALVGSTSETLDRAARRLSRAHPDLRIALCEAPPFGFNPEGEEAQAVAERVGASGARLCLLALGAPKQEIFAAQARRLAPECGFASIGAGLDFAAGAQRRAPLWARRIKGEWLWRLLGAPRRLGPRYLACALILPGLVVEAARRRAGLVERPEA